eukprot:jgi/Mesvir1/7900/Mv11832-RA.1
MPPNQSALDSERGNIDLETLCPCSCSAHGSPQNAELGEGQAEPDDAVSLELLEALPSDVAERIFFQLDPYRIYLLAKASPVLARCCSAFWPALMRCLFLQPLSSEPSTSPSSSTTAAFTSHRADETRCACHGSRAPSTADAARGSSNPQAETSDTASSPLNRPDASSKKPLPAHRPDSWPSCNKWGIARDALSSSRLALGRHAPHLKRSGPAVPIGFTKGIMSLKMMGNMTSALSTHATPGTPGHRDVESPSTNAGLLASPPSAGGTYGSINGALADAVPGDVVLVMPGLYHEHLVGRPGVEVRGCGHDPADVTITNAVPQGGIPVSRAPVLRCDVACAAFPPPSWPSSASSASAPASSRYSDHRDGMGDEHHYYHHPHHRQQQRERRRERPLGGRQEDGSQQHAGAGHAGNGRWTTGHLRAGDWGTGEEAGGDWPTHPPDAYPTSMTGGGYSQGHIVPGGMLGGLSRDPPGGGGALGQGLRGQNFFPPAVADPVSYGELALSGGHYEAIGNHAAIGEDRVVGHFEPVGHYGLVGHSDPPVAGHSDPPVAGHSDMMVGHSETVGFLFEMDAHAGGLVPDASASLQGAPDDPSPFTHRGQQHQNHDQQQQRQDHDDHHQQHQQQQLQQHRGQHPHHPTPRRSWGRWPRGRREERWGSPEGWPRVGPGDSRDDAADGDDGMVYAGDDAEGRPRGFDGGSDRGNDRVLFGVHLARRDERRSGGDHGNAGGDHGNAGGDHGSAGSDHGNAGSDHGNAGVDALISHADPRDDASLAAAAAAGSGGAGVPPAAAVAAGRRANAGAAPGDSVGTAAGHALRDGTGQRYAGSMSPAGCRHIRQRSSVHGDDDGVDPNGGVDGADVVDAAAAPTVPAAAAAAAAVIYGRGGDAGMVAGGRGENAGRVAGGRGENAGRVAGGRGENAGMVAGGRGADARVIRIDGSWERRHAAAAEAWGERFHSVPHGSRPVGSEGSAAMISTSTTMHSNPGSPPMTTAAGEVVASLPAEHAHLPALAAPAGVTGAHGGQAPAAEVLRPISNTSPTSTSTPSSSAPPPSSVRAAAATGISAGYGGQMPEAAGEGLASRDPSGEGPREVRGHEAGRGQRGGSDREGTGVAGARPTRLEPGSRGPTWPPGSRGPSGGENVSEWVYRSYQAQSEELLELVAGWQPFGPHVLPVPPRPDLPSALTQLEQQQHHHHHHHHHGPQQGQQEPLARFAALPLGTSSTALPAGIEVFPLLSPSPPSSSSSSSSSSPLGPLYPLASSAPSPMYALSPSPPGPSPPAPSPAPSLSSTSSPSPTLANSSIPSAASASPSTPLLAHSLSSGSTSSSDDSGRRHAGLEHTAGLPTTVRPTRHRPRASPSACGDRGPNPPLPCDRCKRGHRGFQSGTAREGEPRAGGRERTSPFARERTPPCARERTAGPESAGPLPFRLVGVRIHAGYLCSAGLSLGVLVSGTVCPLEMDGCVVACGGAVGMGVVIEDGGVARISNCHLEQLAATEGGGTAASTGASAVTTGHLPGFLDYKPCVVMGIHCRGPGSSVTLQCCSFARCGLSCATVEDGASLRATGCWFRDDNSDPCNPHQPPPIIHAGIGVFAKGPFTRAILRSCLLSGLRGGGLSATGGAHALLSRCFLHKFAVMPAIMASRPLTHVTLADCAVEECFTVARAETEPGDPRGAGGGANGCQVSLHGCVWRACVLGLEGPPGAFISRNSGPQPAGRGGKLREGINAAPRPPTPCGDVGSGNSQGTAQCCGRQTESTGGSHPAKGNEIGTGGLSASGHNGHFRLVDHVLAVAGPLTLAMVCHIPRQLRDGQ